MKNRTDVHAGVCYGDWQSGTVERVEGNGYYASVMGDDGNRRFVNYAYTEFYPNNQTLWKGERVIFTLHPQGWPNAGKVSCIDQSA